MPEKEFSFSDEIVHELTNGDCWNLAMALHVRTGFPFAAMYGDGQIVHVGVEMPDGNIVDVEGVWDPLDWENRWVELLEHIWEFSVCTVNTESPGVNHCLDYDEPIENYFYGDSTLREIANVIAGTMGGK